ncbi:RNA-dependent RNA polymerase [Hubei insect virus 2]|uniref:RNA-dependent RNA polymerase n=1 Tax=Hubei insect virus 2 TaxID=1922898 RepID=UPI0009096AC4|nr:RNA-dependent RNA polymerase [Hubei insect virus 2]APG79055.1 RNA-dependent RNA polymerase [Hubei insect virus 2]
MFSDWHKSITTYTYYQLELPYNNDYIEHGPLFRFKRRNTKNSETIAPRTPSSKTPLSSTQNKQASDRNSATKRSGLEKNERVVKELTKDDEEEQERMLRDIKLQEKIQLYKMKDRLELENREYVFRHLDVIRGIHDGTSALTLDRLKLLDRLSQILKYNPRQIYAYFHVCEPRAELKLNADSIDKDLYYMFNPPKTLNLDWFDILPEYTCSNQAYMRYMPNVDVRWLSDEYLQIRKNMVQKYNKIHATNKTTITLTSVMKMYKDREVSLADTLKFLIYNGCVKMHSQLTFQVRYGSYEKFLMLFLFLRQTCCEAEYFVNITGNVKGNGCNSSDSLNTLQVIDICKSGLDLVGIQYITRIIKHYVVLPFSFINEKIIYDNIDKPISTQLPIVVLSLLNLSMNEYLGAITKDDAIYGAKYILYCARESLSNTHLNVKGKSRGWYDMILRDTKHYATHTYSKEGKLSGTSYCQTDGDIQFPDDKRTFMGEISKMDIDNPIIKFANDVYLANRAMNEQLSSLKKRSHGNISLYACYKREVSKYTEWLRYVYLAIMTITNPGIYHKTSLAIEYYKSLGIQVVEGIRYPTILEKWNLGGADWYAHKYDWYSVSKELGMLYHEFVSTYSDTLLDRMSNKDYNEYFLLALTHKSGGDKLSLDNKQLEALFGQVSNTRFASYALEYYKYDVVAEFCKLLLAEKKNTTRDQNDRRVRIITIVVNAVQAGELPFLYAFNILKFLMNEIAVGKQVGNMVDALKQLYASGNPHLVCNSSDIAGMDAHTLPVTTLLYRNAVSNILENDGSMAGGGVGTRTMNFLCMNSGLVTMQTVNGNGQRYLSAASKMIDVVNGTESQNAILKDGMFVDELSVNKDVFASGLYGTSATHTIMLSVVHKVVKKMYDAKFPGNHLDVSVSILGDDQFEIMDGSISEIDAWRKMKSEFMRNINYKEEAVFSRFSGVFLQQAAMFGSIVPYPARISMFDDERSENIWRMPHESVSLLIDHVRKLAQRCYGFENYASVARSLWNSIRYTRLNLDSGVKQVAQKYVATMSKYDSDHTMKDSLTIEGNESYFRYPYLLINCNPISLPLQLMYIDKYDRIVLPQMSTAVKGEFAKHALTKCFILSEGLNEEINDENVFIHRRNNLLMTAIDWQERAKYGITFGEHILKYNRQGQRLAKLKQDEQKMSIINSIALDLKNKLNTERLWKSVKAKAKLKIEFGEVFPGIGMGYEEVPKQRLLQALMTVEENPLEAVNLDFDFFMHLTNFTVIPRQVGEYVSTLFHVTPPKNCTDAMIMSRSGLMNWELSLLPCMYRGSDMAVLLLYSEVPVNDFNAQSASRISKINSELTNNVEVETVVRIGMELYSKRHDSDVVIAFGEFIGLGIDIANELALLVVDTYNHGFSNTYTSIFDKPIFFFITSTSDICYRNCNISALMPEKKQLIRFKKLLSRDFIHSYCKYYIDERFSHEYINTGDLINGNYDEVTLKPILLKPELILSVMSQYRMQNNFFNRGMIS